MSLQATTTPSQRLKTPGTHLVDVKKPQRDFPVWHYAMVNDKPRNEAIARAISKLDLRGKTIVEIGTGTGLVALLFAKYGAERVVTCEMNGNLAAMAQRIIAKTPYADKITVIHQSSTAALAQNLLPLQPDVIFTETLDCGVVGEGFISIAADIAKLAGPETLVMPITVDQTAQLISSVSIADCNRAGMALGFDLSDLNEYSTGNYFPIRTELHEHRFLSAAQLMRNFTYIDCPAPERKTFEILNDGILHGVLSWFEADFNGARASNEPRSGSHWHQAYHPLLQEIHVSAGQFWQVVLDDEGYATAQLT